MLVLTRKQEQKIFIGPHVTITVLRVKANSVKIGVEAPDGMRIFRGELIAPNRKQSAAGGGADRADRSASLRRAADQDQGTGSDAPGREPGRPDDANAPSESAGERREPVGPTHGVPRRRSPVRDRPCRKPEPSLAACG